MTQRAAASLLRLPGKHRKWVLRPDRRLSPCVVLAADVSPNPHPAALTVKTLHLPDPAAVSLLQHDLEQWTHAAASCPVLLPIIDVCVTNDTVVHILAEYLPAAPRPPLPERSALRLVASLAAAVYAIISHGRQPAHANLALEHVYLDSQGHPKLAGFGHTRARRLSSRRPLSQRHDVRALAAVLHHLLFAAPPDSSRPGALPPAPRVSPVTENLLRDALQGKVDAVPDLAGFLYDLEAARGLLPVCTPALPPVARNDQRERFLGEDLDSVRGLSAPNDPRRDAHARVERAQEGAAPRRTSPPAQPRPVQTIASEEAELVAREGDHPGELDVMGTVRCAAGPEPTPWEMEEVQRLVEACVKEPDDVSQTIFKALFTLPVSKNPVAAFKAVTLMHQLLSEGPAKFTALAITHHGFLNWTEQSWTRQLLQNRAGKTHKMAYCFAGGDIAVYAWVLRRRTEVQAKFAKVFSTHWVPRPDGLDSITDTRADAFLSILMNVLKCSTLLVRVVASEDPLAAVKKQAVPLMVAEVAKSYLALCWLYATGDEQQKTQLQPKLAAAHSAARSAILAVRADPVIAANCSPHSLLSLEEDVPAHFNVPDLVSALRKKTKKKKKKTTTSVEREDFEQLENREDPENTESKNEEHTVTSEPTEELDPEDESEEEEQEAQKESDEPPPVRQTLRKAPRGENGVPRARVLSRAEAIDRPRQVLEESAPQERSHPPVNGMAKLSLSVRAAARSPYGEDHRGEAARRVTGPSGIRRRSPSPGIDTRTNIILARRYPGAEREYEPHSDSDEGEYEPRRNGKNRRTVHRSEGRERRKPKPQSSSDSESDSSEEEEEKEIQKSRRTKRVKVQTKKSKKVSDDDSASSEDGEPEKKGKGKGKVRPRKRSPKKKAHVDEKKIPFDKEMPSKKRPVKRSNGATEHNDADYSGGSKEALAAAASGKKTPSINTKFEVAPYEVHFGPQVGSGGFGVVFKAKFRGETVAVKKIHAHALSNASSVAEFQSEVAVLCTLRHPNILRFVGACTKPPNLMIITEFMSRGTLFDVLHQSQIRVTWPMRKKFALDTCRGMRYLHDSKLLHRDLKSSNLMLDKDFNCKVGDFGLTRISKGTAAVQMTGQCGTFQYMAVEVLANKPYSEKADVFSFGILLWEMVARKLPYFGMQPMQVGIAVLQQGMRPPIPAKCPLQLAKLMRACWDSDPNRRPSFAQLVQVLEAMPE